MLSNWRTVILHEDLVIPERGKRDERGGEGRGEKEGGERKEGRIHRKERSDSVNVAMSTEHYILHWRMCCHAN